MQVEADIFSGRPNPRWTLDEADTAVVAAMLGALRPAPRAPAEAPGLGYRGVVLTGVEAAYPGCSEVRLHGATATVTCIEGTRHLADPGRRVETWIVQTARRHVEPEVFQAIADSLAD